MNWKETFSDFFYRCKSLFCANKWLFLSGFGTLLAGILCGCFLQGKRILSQEECLRYFYAMQTQGFFPVFRILLWEQLKLLFLCCFLSLWKYTFPLCYLVAFWKGALFGIAFVLTVQTVGVGAFLLYLLVCLPQLLLCALSLCFFACIALQRIRDGIMKGCFVSSVKPYARHLLVVLAVQILIALLCGLILCLAVRPLCFLF